MSSLFADDQFDKSDEFFKALETQYLLYCPECDADLPHVMRLPLTEADVIGSAPLSYVGRAWFECICGEQTEWLTRHAITQRL